jgi:hypothetical protein
VPADQTDGNDERNKSNQQVCTPKVSVAFKLARPPSVPRHRTTGALRGPAKRGMLGRVEPLRRNAMPTQIGENRAKKMLKANELVLCMGVNQLRTPNIAMIAAACGFDAVYIDLEHNPTSLELPPECVLRHWA